MIYWNQLWNFESACKLIKYLTYEEYVNLMYKRASLDYKDERVKLLWAAGKHFSNLRKLDLVSAGKYGHPPKVERFDYGNGYIEFTYFDPVRKRKRKICGYPKKGLPVGWRCLRTAGLHTAHLGYGYCMAHEIIENPEVRMGIWLRLREIHGVVSTLDDILVKAQRIDEVAGKTIEADIAYLEIARQIIMFKIQEGHGIITRELTNDLAVVTESVAKVKALKSKIDHITDIPVSQVGAMIIQVLNAVTNGESTEVKARIAARARDLSSLIIPQLDSQPAGLPSYTRPMEVRAAIQIAEEHIDESWGDIPGVAGYTIKKPTKPEPNYKKTHPLIHSKIKLRPRKSNGENV